jgi:hypothetical protein
MKYKYKLLAEEILEEYVNAYSEVDLDRVAKKIEQVAKDTAENFAEVAKGRAYQSTDWSHGEHPMVVDVDDICEIYEEIMGE